nr:unnamed protein product [Callosobruchus chinensis]
MLHLSANEKQIVLNIYKNQVQENGDMLVEELVQKVAVISGISRTSVNRIVREYRSNHPLSEPKAYPSRKKINEAIDDFDRGAIRRKVHSFFFRNELPIVDKILKDVSEDTDLPNFKRTTFYQLLKELDFRFLKRGRNSLLLEKKKSLSEDKIISERLGNFETKGEKSTTWTKPGSMLDILKEKFGWTDLSSLQGKLFWGAFLLA